MKIKHARSYANSPLFGPRSAAPSARGGVCVCNWGTGARNGQTTPQVDAGNDGLGTSRITGSDPCATLKGRSQKTRAALRIKPASERLVKPRGFECSSEQFRLQRMLLMLARNMLIIGWALL